MRKTIEVLKGKYILLAGLVLVAVVTVFGDKGIYELYKVRNKRARVQDRGASQGQDFGC